MLVPNECWIKPTHTSASTTAVYAVMRCGLRFGRTTCWLERPQPLPPGLRLPRHVSIGGPSHIMPTRPHSLMKPKILARNFRAMRSIGLGCPLDRLRGLPASPASLPYSAAIRSAKGRGGPEVAGPRVRTRATWAADQLPAPRAVGMPRPFSPSAIARARRDVFPAACSANSRTET